MGNILFLASRSGAPSIQKARPNAKLAVGGQKDDYYTQDTHHHNTQRRKYHEIITRCSQRRVEILHPTKRKDCRLRIPIHSLFDMRRCWRCQDHAESQSLHNVHYMQMPTIPRWRPSQSSIAKHFSSHICRDILSSNFSMVEFNTRHFSITIASGLQRWDPGGTREVPCAELPLTFRDCCRAAGYTFDGMGSSASSWTVGVRSLRLKL